MFRGRPLVEIAVFWIAALLALGGAVGVVVQRNPFYSVLSLVVHLVALAVLFLLLRAEFLAAAQVIVYAGAVMVLYVFVVAYVGGLEDPLIEPNPVLRVSAPIFAGALLVELSIAIIGSGLKAIDSEGAELGAGFGSPAQIGELFLTRFLIPFEVVSYLLLVAAVGAVVLARHDEGQADRRQADDRVSGGINPESLSTEPKS
jgi:NADH-quinone oxidoreductase subunit J